MKALAIGALLAVFLAGCSSPAQDAEDQYNIVAASGDHDQRCEEAGKVRDAWLKAKNKAQYESWDLQARMECTAAQLDRMKP